MHEQGDWGQDEKEIRDDAEIVDECHHRRLPLKLQIQPNFGI